MNEAEIKNVRCVSTCDTFSIMRGDYCYLPLPKARLLESMHAVRIVEKVPKKVHRVADDDYLFRYAYSRRNLTKVAWIQNYSKVSGAEISNFNLVRVGRNLGFDIVGVVVDTLQSFELAKHADIIIVNNLHSCNRDIVIEYLKKTTIPWIKYEHDLLETDFDLYKKSTKNIFISPLQKKFYIEKCGEDIESKSACLPIAINPDGWEFVNNGREPNSIFVPAYHKCRENFKRFHEQNQNDKKFYIAGTGYASGKNILSVGEVPYTNMLAMYHQFDTVYHAPDKPFAGDRILFESILSGCKVIINKNVGHSSWDFNWKDETILRPILKNALYQFWHEVDKVLYAA